MANNWNTTLGTGIIAQSVGSAIPGITVSSGSGIINSATLNNISLSQHDFNLGSNAHVKRYQVFEIEEDLLALSVAWKRLRDNHANGGHYISIEKLLDKNLFANLTDSDREVANEIRDYYSKKVMMWKLKGQLLSKFREDMNSFIHTNGKIFKEEMLPLVYRLPQFYEYDVGFDILSSDCNKIVKTDIMSNFIQNKRLSLKKTFMVNKRVAKRKEYWFTDEADNLVTLSVLQDNPLISLIDLHTENPITLTAKFNVKERDNTQYMVADKYTFS